MLPRISGDVSFDRTFNGGSFVNNTQNTAAPLPSPTQFPSAFPRLNGPGFTTKTFDAPLPGPGGGGGLQPAMTMNAAPMGASNVAGSAVRASNFGGFNPQFGQNLSIFDVNGPAPGGIMSNFARQGNLTNFDPFSKNPFAGWGQQLGGGNAPLTGLPIEALQMALLNSPFMNMSNAAQFIPPPQQPPTQAPGPPPPNVPHFPAPFGPLANNPFQPVTPTDRSGDIFPKAGRFM